MVSFIFGGNTNETPESLKRKREMIEAMIAGQRPPQNWGEGWGAVMKGIASGVLRKRADTAEAAGRQSGDSVYNKITSMLTGGSPATGGTSGLPAGGATAGNIPMTGAAGELAGTQPGAMPDMTGNEVYSGFMDTVKAGGVDNPYALAAIAATGNAESRFSPGNVNRTWSDPSERGQAGTAGGVMSWRGPRLAKLQAYAASKGEQGNGTPQTQAEYLLQEDPNLIGALKNAGSVEEAQSLMNNAWKFAGYNRAGGEADRRLKAAQGYLPTFQGNGEVASASPETAFSAVMPEAGGGGSLSDEVAAYQQTPEYRAQFPGMSAQQTQNLPIDNQGQQAGDQLPRQFAGSQQLMAAKRGMMPALTGGEPASAQQVAQAQALAQQDGTQMSGPSLQQLYDAAANPWLSPEQKAIVGQMLEQELQKRDPSHQLDIRYRQAQVDKLERDASADKKQPLINAGGGSIYDPNSGEWLQPPSEEAGNGPFRFSGKSVEAQALNGLMDSGALTPDQAQQLGAGKTITGPNGEIIFMTPQGVFGHMPDGQTEKLSGGGQSQDGASVQNGQNGGKTGGNLQITEPKVTLDERKAMGFADRMKQSGGIIDDNENAGLNVKDQFIRGNDWIPDFAENWLVSNDFQKFDQARRDFINAQLRRESGAVISTEEFDNARQQYFPQPGDGEDVLKQKAANRKTVIDAMKRDAGPTYGTDNSGALSEARAAIAKGASREAVIQRLQQMGINPEGL